MRVLIALLSGLLVLSGCTQIPRSGPVESVNPSSVLNETDVDFLPPGPSAGASPEDILEGFIAAGTAAQNNYRVARSYLTDQFHDTWNPSQSALISQGEASVLSSAESELVYQVQVIASVDEAGRYEVAAQPTTQDLVFSLEEVSGQWRISEAPDGVVLGEVAFREAFDSYLLYYYSADYRELVPDLRWFASRGDVLTKVIRGLLEPPSYWLGQAATVSAFPPGTQLTLSPVPVTDGQAQVDLSEAVLDTATPQREQMLVQLTTTLQQVSGVSDVVITVNQAPVRVPALDEDQPGLSTGRDPRSVVVRGVNFGYLQAGQIDTIDALSSTVISLRPDHAFYHPGFQQAAVVNEDGLYRVGESGTSEEPWDTREGLIRPLIDSCGYTWSMTAEPGEEALRIFSPIVVDIEFNATVLPVELPAGSRVVTMELARDNTRLLLVVQTDNGVRTLLTAIQRSPDCEPIGLGEFRELSALEGEAVDAAWVDEYQVAVVTRDGSAGDVVIQDVNGQMVSAGRPTGPQTLVAGVGGLSGLRLLNDQGAILQPRGNGWQTTGDRASVLVTQR